MSALANQALGYVPDTVKNAGSQFLQGFYQPTVPGAYGTLATSTAVGYGLGRQFVPGFLVVPDGMMQGAGMGVGHVVSNGVVAGLVDKAGGQENWGCGDLGWKALVRTVAMVALTPILMVAAQVALNMVGGMVGMSVDVMSINSAAMYSTEMFAVGALTSMVVGALNGFMAPRI